MRKFTRTEVYDCLRRYWGFTEFRAGQAETVRALLNQRESLTVLPTGGGKSVCFQLPAMLHQGMAVVISPLISLMKDQVDGLRSIGIPAACLNSGMDSDEHRKVIDAIKRGTLKLLYLSPERLSTPGTMKLLESAKMSFWVIDEAHCISHWGHDFREEYRMLGGIRRQFPGVKVHAFTATATKEVKRDILQQLALTDPMINVASVDRPNLTYRVMSRANIMGQICEAIAKHPGQAGIVYCLRRRDVDHISEGLNQRGYKNLPYHAGLPDSQRRAAHEQFKKEGVNLIVATVAFGMGIDRPDIRFVIHAAMPQSIEQYYQETGRAGRDGLPSFCYMFYAGNDYKTWELLTQEAANRQNLIEKLKVIYNLCAQPQCRHRVFVRYFGQEYDQSACRACDFCLGELEMVEDPVSITRKVLACVQSLQKNSRRSFGGGQIALILKGELTDRIRRWGHHENEWFGAMSGESLRYIRYMIEQIAGQDYLARQGEYNTLAVNEAGKRFLEGAPLPIALAKPLFLRRRRENDERAKTAIKHVFAGADADLFEILRKKRKELAQSQNVPPYVVFKDDTLIEIANRKPETREAFASIPGVGQVKLEKYSAPFIAAIKEFLKSK